MWVLIAAIVLTPGAGAGRDVCDAYGELGTILERTERQAVGRLLERQNPPLFATGVVDLVAGARFELTTFRL